MPLTLKAVNAELAKHGHKAMLVKGDGYFYFRGGDATDWLDRTVRVPTLNSLTLDRWIAAFVELKNKNRQITAGAAGPRSDSAAVPKHRGRRSRPSADS